MIMIMKRKNKLNQGLTYGPKIISINQVKVEDINKKLVINNVEINEQKFI